MIDSFVLLAPLMFLPFTLLLVFVGCTGEIGTAAFPVNFTYQSLGADVAAIDVTWTGTLVLGEGTAVLNLASIERVKSDFFQLDGEIITVGTISAASKGSVTCHCLVTPEPRESTIELTTTKQKLEGDAAPSFTLFRVGDNFSLD